MNLDTKEVRAGLHAFLLALPLSLGIAVASSAPPVAGLITAIVGGLLTGVLGGAPSTIKGPAAGLIVIVAGAIAAFGGGVDGYRAMLAIAVAAGVLQVVLAQLRADRVLRFVPPAVIHGMLASIGVVIVVKQLPAILGVSVAGATVFESLAHVTTHASSAVPSVVLVAVAAAATLLVHGRLPERWQARVPAPLAAVLVAAVAAMGLGVPRQIGTVEPFLAMPASIAAAIVHPDFAVLQRSDAWWWVMLLTAIGSLESLLTVRAVDDWTEQRSDLAADLRATGIANAVAGCLGGIPMISEVVRTRANVAAGGRGRWSNAVHGGALLVALLALAGPLHAIPMAALAVLLVFVGATLASPDTLRREVARGYDQLLIFTVTLVGCLATDLLVGIGLGLVCKVSLHRLHGASWSSLLRPSLTSTIVGGTATVRVYDAAVFSSFHYVRRAIERARERAGRVVVDLREVPLVDHTVMADLRELAGEGVQVRGLQHLSALGPDATATRVMQPLPSVAWLTKPERVASEAR